VSDEASSHDEDDLVEELLSWRFKAGGMGLFIGLPALLLALDQWDDDRSLGLAAIGPLGVTAYPIWRYLQARREVVARGLWPQPSDDPPRSAT
jgi:hypothetical protein